MTELEGYVPCPACFNEVTKLCPRCGFCETCCCCDAVDGYNVEAENPF